MEVLSMKKITKNELMQKLLVDGDVLNAGICRGDIHIVLIPEQNKTNDKRMKERSGILYGNTKFTDEQIIYFYKKHKGNASAASRELRINLSSYKQRLSSLGLKPKGSAFKFTDKQIINSYNKHNGNARVAAREIKMSFNCYLNRLSLLELKPLGKKGTNNTYSDKTIIWAMKKTKNHAHNAALLVGCSYTTMLERIKRLKIEAKGSSGRKRKK